MLQNLTETIQAIKGNPIENLQKDSKNILDVFTKTVTDLQAVNKKSDKLSEIKLFEKKKLEEELHMLSVIKTDNEKVISKISKIFE